MSEFFLLLSSIISRPTKITNCSSLNDFPKTVENSKIFRLVGNSYECDDQCVKQCPYVAEKELGGVIMDKGYWDDKVPYFPL